MLEFVNGLLKKFFGSKAESDLKGLSPYVPLVNNEYQQLSSLTNDQLRNRTFEFRNKINEHIASVEKELQELTESAENNPEMDLQEKENIFSRVDQLKKDRNAKIEEVLLEILPAAFAVVKETARRYKETPELEVTALDHDREVAVKRSSVVIRGDKAYYQSTWMAAGNQMTWDMLHYDVQLIGGTVLHQGKIAEMATGEGKTLVATLPIYLNALAGRGVHVVTVNDYLAKRDSEWNGPVFEFLGLSVDCIDKHQPNSAERRKAYMADVTYGTNNEFGFDYLRDNMARSPEDIVQREHHFAIVDEVDSVLIDDARTPLIISGPTPKGDDQEFFQLKPRIETLVTAQRNYVNTLIADAKKNIDNKAKEEEVGLALLRANRGLPKHRALIKLLSEPGARALLQKTENTYLADQGRQMREKVDPELYFVIDEKNHTIEMTDKGHDMISANSNDPHFFELPDVGSVIADIEKSNLSPEEKLEKKDVLMRDYAVKGERIHTINQLLRAYTMYEKDVEYIIDGGKVKIVDEQTGRVLDGRRYSDGLHQAIEAKENVKVEAATQTYATVTLQNYFRMYHKLAGMTGTAETEAGELWQIYKLDVVVIPTHRKISRKDEEDLVYKTTREKYNAVIEEIVKLTEAGRPVLVGTTSVEVSELLSRMLQQRKIKHNVLNAKQHQREAEIVAQAGLPSQVTIATNMAGRGTDIKLGPGVKEAGGLAIIGTERHESRRVDRQLRGRAGRQGDPGSSQFFVSLEDNLMRLFGSERIAKLMDTLGLKEGEVIQHSMITKSIERAQRKVEENNFGIRKRLLEYDDVMNAQREVIYKKRRHALYGERLALDLQSMLYDLSDSIANQYVEDKDFENFNLEMIRLFAMESPISQSDFQNAKSADEISDKLFDALDEHYRNKVNMIAERAYPVVKEVYEKEGQQYENIIVPFSDGVRNIQILAPLRKSYETQGKEITAAFERSVTLSLIDDAWKEHLREMDDLKQSVQNAVYEQKDPLLVYKLESFNLFKKMVDEINHDTMSFLFRGVITVQEQQPVKQAPAPQKQDLSKLRATHEEYNNNVSSTAGPGNPNGGAVTQQAPPQKQEPIRNENKTLPNDPCPCGSGKKYKKCHGAMDH
ncbi:MAG TPA: preprotein translocase subunit SecA [Bacteroidia bacterium]|nr:preprotein translocase subunit SecA [Bacteroidia bacterium]HQK96741.1 preprotein translocase subunit SecA [Bacteroidia bacterium]